MFRLLFALIRFFLLAVFSLVVLFFFRNTAARFLMQTIASNAIGLPFEIQKVRFVSYVPLVLQGTGYVWKNPPDFAERRCLSGRNLEVEIGATGWSAGAFRIEKIHFDIDELLVSISPSGESNLARVSALTENADDAPWLSRHLVIGACSFSIQRVLVYDFRSSPAPVPLVYRCPMPHEILAKNQSVAVLTRQLAEHVLARTPLRLGALVRTPSH